MSILGRTAWLGLATLLSAWGQDQGKLILFFLQNQVGEESYQVDAAHTLHADFAYTERGSKVPLTATLAMKPDFTPVRFEAKGKSYRPFSVDAPWNRTPMAAPARCARAANLARSICRRAFLHPRRLRAVLRADDAPALLGRARQAGPPHPFLRSPGTEASDRNRRPGNRGRKVVRLTRYSLGGVVWGRESIWLDDPGAIAAGRQLRRRIPLEAIRDEYSRRPAAIDP